MRLLGSSNEASHEPVMGVLSPDERPDNAFIGSQNVKEANAARGPTLLL